MRASLVIVLLLMLNAQTPAAETSANVHLRGSLLSSRRQMEVKKAAHVAFLGGSITEMNGYRPLIAEILSRRFPETKFTFTNAGIASTCSTTGAFRLGDDVLAKDPVDLIFIEFAVNDDQDAAHSREECIRGMEGIVRQIRAHNPRADIVFTYFVNPSILETIQSGKVPLTIASHEEVAKAYSIPSVNVAKELADRIKAGTMTWRQYGGVHPARPGNELAARLNEQLLIAAWRGPLPAEIAPHTMPEKPVDPFNYGKGRFVSPKMAMAGDGWKLGVPSWNTIKGQLRQRFEKLDLLCAEEPGASLTLSFTGRAVGAYILAGPDAGIVETSIDGGPFRRTDLYHRYSRGLHYPRTVLFADGLKQGPHTLKLRIADQKNPDSTGHAMRILQLTAN